MCCDKYFYIKWNKILFKVTIKFNNKIDKPRINEEKANKIKFKPLIQQFYTATKCVWSLSVFV